MAIAITFDTADAQRISRRMGMMTGKCDFGTQVTAGLAVTDISAKFKTLLSLNFAGNGGYVHQWSKTDAVVKSYEAGADAAALDVLNAVDAGECTFVAIGTIK